jgi:hypothetical protein
MNALTSLLSNPDSRITLAFAAAAVIGLLAWLPDRQSPVRAVDGASPVASLGPGHAVATSHPMDAPPS